MKRSLLIIFIALALLCIGAQVTSTITIVTLTNPFNRWTEVGTITGAQAYPGVADRDYTTVAACTDANTAVINVPNWAKFVMLSFQTTANADSTTLGLMGFASNKQVSTTGAVTLDDDGVYLGQLALTGGLQVASHSNVYVDTIVATDAIAVWDVLDSATDRRAIVNFNAKGFKTIYLFATTLQASSTLYVNVRFY